MSKVEIRPPKCNKVEVSLTFSVWILEISKFQYILFWKQHFWQDPFALSLGEGQGVGLLNGLIIDAACISSTFQHMGLSEA